MYINIYHVTCVHKGMSRAPFKLKCNTNAALNLVINDPRSYGTWMHIKTIRRCAEEDHIYTMIGLPPWPCAFCGYRPGNDRGYALCEG